MPESGGHENKQNNDGPGGSGLDALKVCLNHAQALIDSAAAVLAVGKPNIAYHLAALALEEVGRHELLILGRGVARDPVPPTWPVKHRQDHVEKLFWAFFGAAFARQVLTKESLGEMRKLAELIHSTRLAGLYTEDEEGNIQIPQDAISSKQAENLVEMARARLGIASSYETRSEISESDRQLQEWFLEITTDGQHRKDVFSAASMTKLVELQDARAWIAWLKEQFDEANARGRAIAEAELARQNPSGTSTKNKWRLRIKLTSSSHLVNPKILRSWNQKVEPIKLTAGPTKSDLFVDFYFLETMPLQGLWWSGWALARKFAVALNIGSRGLWWWHLAKDVSRYYETLEDVELHQKIELDQSPRLRVDWGKNIVLNEQDLDLTMRCFVVLPNPNPNDLEKLVPYDYYIAGVHFWALIDVHWRCEIDILGNFHESLKAMMRTNGDWDGDTLFEQSLSDLLLQLIPDLADEQRRRYIELAQAFERHEPDGKNITLTDVAMIKVLCDRYFLDVLAPRALGSHHMPSGGADGQTAMSMDNNVAGTTSPLQNDSSNLA